mgnify:CR=1 FL=1
MTVTGPEKLLYITLGILFLALGIVGLLVPIIPGVLFLAAAVFMLSRGSARVKAYADGHPYLSKLQSRMSRLNTGTVTQRFRVVGLMTLQTFVDGIEKIHQGARRLFT